MTWTFFIIALCYIGFTLPVTIADAIGKSIQSPSIDQPYFKYSCILMYKSIHGSVYIILDQILMLNIRDSLCLLIAYIGHNIAAISLFTLREVINTEKHIWIS